MRWFIAIGKVVLAIIGAAGAVACILVWLKVEPKDVRMMTWPHWLWLIGAIVLFGISLTASLRSLYLALRSPTTEESRNAEQSEGSWPKWKRRQAWQKAEREQLEGEVRKWKDQAEKLQAELSGAAKPSADLRSRVIDVRDDLGYFLRKHGPKPEIAHNHGESDADYLTKAMVVLTPYKTKMGADFRLRCSGPVKNIRDEIQAKGIFSDRPLDKAIELAESEFCEPKIVEEIRKHFWTMAEKMEK